MLGLDNTQWHSEGKAAPLGAPSFSQSLFLSPEEPASEGQLRAGHREQGLRLRPRAGWHQSHSRKETTPGLHPSSDWPQGLLLLPGKSHGQRSMVGYSPWGRKESDMTERLHFHMFILSRNRESSLHAKFLELNILEEASDLRVNIFTNLNLDHH